MNKKILWKSKSIDPDNTQVFELDKSDALLLIQDLINDIAHSGTGKLVLRDDNKNFYVFKVTE